MSFLVTFSFSSILNLWRQLFFILWSNKERICAWLHGQPRRPSSGYKTENTSSDSRGSPADVSSDKPLIYRTSGVLLLCTTLGTRQGTAIFLLFSLCLQYSCIVPVGYSHFTQMYPRQHASLGENLHRF